MIVYVTGAPGSGKTLWTISEVLKMLKAEPDRPVYYFFPEHVPDVDASLNWHRIKERKEAHAVPQRSIIIIDEAWTWYPQRKASSAVPDDIEAYATHRHRGHDFFILTQRVTSVDHFVRGLVGRHVHFERQFGLERSRRFEWQKMGDPGDKFSRQEAMGSEFRFPKDVYKVYRSAEVHTVKKKLPLVRLGVIASMVLALPVLVWLTIKFTLGGFEDKGEEAGIPATNQTTALTHASDFQAQTTLDEAETWLALFAERVEGMPASAPIYDELTRPVTIPRISGCIDIKTQTIDRCYCTTQQGTRITTITTTVCRTYIAHGGWFDWTKPDQSDDQAQRTTVQPAQVYEQPFQQMLPTS